MIVIVQTLRSWASVLSGRKELTAEDVNCAVVLAFTFSIFLPFYFSLVTISCIAFMTMVKCRIRVRAFSAPYTKLIFTFLAGSFFVAAIYSNYKGMAYSILIYAIVTCGLYFRSIMTKRLFNMAMDAACIGSVWCAVAAIVQKAVTYAAAPNYRPVSAFTNANYYGMMVEFVVLIALYRIFTNSKRTSLYAAVIGLNFVGLYLTASCSSFAAMVCASAVILLYKHKSKIALFFAGTVVFGVALFLVFPSLLPRSSVALETTIAQRLSIWGASLRAFRQTPIFGRGATAYQMVGAQYGGYKTFHCHNLMLDMLLNFGLVGTAAIGVYVLMQLRMFVVRFRWRICRDMDVLAVAALVAVLVHGLTDVTILWIQTGAIFFLLLSSSGIQSAFAEERVRVPRLVSSLEGSSAQAVYLKN